MTPVDFRNLIGRVGRIEYNLYGNVFILRYDPNQKQDKFQELIEKDIPEQKISLVSELTKNQKERIVETLLAGNIEFQKYPSNQTEDGYSLMRKFGLILLRDITKGRNSPVKEAFSSLLTPEKEDVIRQHFLAANARTQPDDDINISVDQTETLTAAIERGLTYPELKNGSFDYDEMVVFLTRLCHIFKWGVYERKTLGHVSSKDGTYANLRWYATVLIQWMEGNGLNTIIKEAIVDYVLGIETGLDSNGRKNRGGHQMEDLVEEFIKKTGAEYYKEMYLTDIERKWGVDLSAISAEGTTTKRWDFVVKTHSTIYVIETNFYSGGGSKLNETARSYKMIAEEARQVVGVEFIWITDGGGWRSARRNLEETFNTMTHLYNIDDMENGVFLSLFNN